MNDRDPRMHAAKRSRSGMTTALVIVGKTIAVLVGLVVVFAGLFLGFCAIAY